MNYLGISNLMASLFHFAVIAGGIFYYKKKKSQPRTPKVAQGLESTLGPITDMGTGSTTFSTSEPSSPTNLGGPSSSGAMASAGSNGASASIA